MNIRQERMFSKIKLFFEENGVELISTSYTNNKEPIYFKCKNCGKIHYSSWANISKPSYQFLCRDCNIQAKPSISYISELMKSKGARLLSSEYINAHTKMKFRCSKCGNIGEISWHQIQQKSNTDFLCSFCQPNAKVSQEYVEKIFSDHGVKLLNAYENIGSKLYFNCKNCGKVHHITLSKINRGQNMNFLCPECSKFSPLGGFYNIETIREEFKKRNAELISVNYVNINTPLEFKCSKCGKIHTISYGSFKKGVNPNLLCTDCLKGNTLNPDGLYGHTRRLVDNFWYSLIFEFFNVSNDYSAHHIRPWAAYPDFRTSILNGFPLRKDVHKNSYVDESGRKNPFHMYFPYLNPENWPQFVKLPYHTYEDFKFHDLNKFMITEILYKDSDTKNLFNKKAIYYKKGIFYIPLYFEELFIDSKRSIIFSMIRNRLYKEIPDIFLYTGTTLSKFYARNLSIKIVDARAAKEFFNSTHIQGFVSAEVYIGLFKGDRMLCCMSFSKSRFNSEYEWELIRFSSALNTIIVGGASRLFKYFINNYCPKSVISYCDVRFSSTNPEDTVYHKLGFKYIGYSKPNYKWLDPKLNRIYSRQKYQKHKLPKLLSNYDDSLSETQNMYNNGYIKLYDCGNFKFGWRNDNV